MNEYIVYHVVTDHLMNINQKIVFNQKNKVEFINASWLKKIW